MAKKILIAGAGGAPSEGVINSLLQCNRDEVIGMGSEPTDLALSAASRKYYVPYSNTPGYKDALIKILKTEKPDLLHFQNDLEIFVASGFRDDIHANGTKLFMPSHDVIDTCVNKYKSYLKWKEAGVRVPENALLNDKNDLKKSF